MKVRRSLRAAAVVAVIGVIVAVTLISTGLVSDTPSRCTTDGRTVAQIWNDALLDAIRRDVPAPTVHARNLFHLSAVMWDAWAAYEVAAIGVFVDVEADAADVESERTVAISYAAHRLLSARYLKAIGGDASLAQFDQVFHDLCGRKAHDRASLSPSAELGIQIAEFVLTTTLNDGSLESNNYIDVTYEPANPPLNVTTPGTKMVDANRWQPLWIESPVTQNGVPLDSSLQEFIGPNWGSVLPFALDDSSDGSPAIDPGPPPKRHHGTDGRYAEAASEVVMYSSRLDTESSRTIDISPRSIGNTTLGTYDPVGWSMNPETGRAYASNRVLEADFGRVIAEYWADGPDSETPPGHWNVIASGVGDELQKTDNLAIDGVPVGRLEWDLKIGLALNGALHDAAIAAWGIKAHYDYVRPISMIRHLGSAGEMEVVPGAVELITERSSADGQRHAHLRRYVGENAVYSWIGEPPIPKAMLGGVAWIRAAEWMPYQRASFVTPSFAAYVSGHSVFSRAAAEVLTELTGSAFFPGGLSVHGIEPGQLRHEEGPSATIELQWATYRDAADQAGLSRLYGGIHILEDDLYGRIVGAAVGEMAVSQARQYFG